MTRAKLEKYLGKNVEIVIFDDTIIRGVLHRTGEEIFKDEPNYYVPKNYYFCLDENGECAECIFKVSHIRKIARRDGEKQ